MKRLIYHIIRLALGFIPVVLTVASAVAQKPVTHWEIDKCETVEFSVVDMPGDEYTWDFFKSPDANYAVEDDRLDPALYFEDGDYRDSSTVKIHGLDTGHYFLRIMAWDETNCTNNLMLFSIDITETLPEAYLTGDSACINEPTEVKIILTGTGPWEVLFTDGLETQSYNFIGTAGNNHTIPIMRPLPVGTTEFWVMEVVEDDGVCRVVNSNPSERVGVVIFPKPTNSKIYVDE